MIEKNRNLIIGFINNIWNDNQFEEIDNYLHPSFTDHSLPPDLTADKTGLIAWITGTGKAFTHYSVIEQQVTDAERSMIKFSMHLKHIGIWRGLQPTGIDIVAVGYRCFGIQDGKIIAHWGLVDGNAIENQIKEATHGCKIQQ